MALFGWLAVAGPGPISLDRLLQGWREHQAELSPQKKWPRGGCAGPRGKGRISGSKPIRARCQGAWARRCSR